MPEELEDGDEIEIGQVERGGVKLLFQLTEESGSSEIRVTRATRQSRITNYTHQSEEDRF